jgi:cell division protein FtsZ
MVARSEPVVRHEPVARAEAVARAEHRLEPELRLDPEMRSEPEMRANPEMKDLHKALSEISDAAPAPTLAQQPPQGTRRMGGLLDRLVNRHRAPAQPALQPQPQPQPRMEARREPTATRAGEDLDIPAFLRRQAN